MQGINDLAQVERTVRRPPLRRGLSLYRFAQLYPVLGQQNVIYGDPLVGFLLLSSAGVEGFGDVCYGKRQIRQFWESLSSMGQQNTKMPCF